jgi:hypothetical protein
VKKGWSCSTTCIFYGEDERTDHLFISCSFGAEIWEWIINYNNIYFEGSTVHDLWTLDYGILLKNKYVMELIKGVVHWAIWFERNRLCSNTCTPKSVAMLDM